MSVGLRNQKEVPTVENSTIEFAAARLGAASLAARPPWTNVVAPLPGGTGVNHARIQQAADQMAQRPESALLTAAELLPMTTSISTVTFTRKPKNVHKTRINAGGYGAMGPHPERQRLA
jgi:hypothetical protein